MRNRYLLLADVLAVALAAWAAFAFRFGWLFLDFRAEFPLFFAVALVAKISVLSGSAFTAATGGMPDSGTC
ncbi:MAG: hypothetical protein O2973_14040 [Gemmatimonadetes bacterium]|nr:hypothetical protein [Gemmatimonadota bacterium]